MAAPRFPLRIRSTALAACVCATSALAIGLAHSTVSGAHESFEAEDPEPEPACIDVWPEARYRNYGYDHIVHLLSRCEAEALCSVATDVNPDPVEVPVAAGAEIEVLTFRGSPAREFTPRVSCRFRV